MKDAIEGTPGYAKLEEDCDVAGLMKTIKMLSYGLDEEQYEPWVMQSTMRKLFNLEQGPNETWGTFIERFKSQLAVTESVYGPLVPTPSRCYPMD